MATGLAFAYCVQVCSDVILSQPLVAGYLAWKVGSNLYSAYSYVNNGIEIVRWMSPVKEKSQENDESTCNSTRKPTSSTIDSDCPRTSWKDILIGSPSSANRKTQEKLV